MIAYLSEHGEKWVQSTDTQVVSMLADLATLIGKAIGNASQMAMPVAGLTLYQNTVPTAPNPCTYGPRLLVIPQGRKRVDLGMILRQ